MPCCAACVLAGSAARSALSACDEVRANFACPRAEGRLALRRAPLDNRKIAFGCGRQAIRRLCARPLSWRARSSSRWHVCGLGSAAVVAPPSRIAFSPVRGIHPRMRLAWLGRNTSRHPARPPRGACRTRAADSLWPRSSLASPRPLFAIPILSRRAASRCTPYGRALRAKLTHQALCTAHQALGTRHELKGLS